MDVEEWVSKFPARPPDPYRNELMAKPTQFSNADRFMRYTVRTMREHRLTQLLLYLLEKADGHSCVLECLPDRTWRLSHRTETNSVLLDQFDMRQYLTQLAFDLRVKFMVELCALFNGEEMGYLEVMSMLATFKQNKCRNVGPFQLLIRPFGVHSITHEGRVRSGACVDNADLFQFLDACIVPDNGLVRRVGFTEVSCRLCGESLEFFSVVNSHWLAPKDFFEECIAEANRLRIEGYVLRGLFDKLAPPVFTRDTYGKRLPRHDAQVKVKQAFPVNLVACKVLNTSRQVDEIWLYGRKGQKLVYAGQAFDHVLLQNQLQRCPTNFQFKDQRERESLKSLFHENLVYKKASFFHFEGTCTNFSKTNYKVLGLKYDLRSFCEQAIPFESLSEPERVATANRHFNLTKSASNRYANEIGRDMVVPQAAPKTSRKQKPPVVQARLNAPKKARAASPDVVEIIEIDDDDEKPCDGPRVAFDLEELKMYPIQKGWAMKSVQRWGGKIFVSDSSGLSRVCPLEEAQIIVTSEAAKPKFAVPHFTMEELKARFDGKTACEKVWATCLAEKPVL